MASAKNTSNNQNKSEINHEKGLDNWNDRLDENLESNDQNDVTADENAKDFSSKNGSGNQSDKAKPVDFKH